MPMADVRAKAPPTRTTRAAGLAVAVVCAPLLLLTLLRLWPSLDVGWENHPAHFWLVLAASAVSTGLGYAVVVAARRRADARLLLIGLAFVSAAGFLGLHALATPGVLVGPNAGFELATPAGLALGGVFVAVSSAEMDGVASRRIVARAPLLIGGLFVLMALWAVVSLAQLPPLDDPVPQESLDGWQLGFAAVGIAGYAVGAVGYLRLHRRRPGRFVLSVAVAFGLLAAAMLVIAFAVNWRLSWWEWHVLMLAAFGLIAFTARKEWYEERFSALYLEETLAGTREASVLFADLQGFTTFAEQTSAREVRRMLNTYYARLLPLMQRLHGDVHDLIGDAVMVVFNKRGDQPDHAELAARAALAFQEAAAAVRTEPHWPCFRVGVNSGEVMAGVVGEHGHRKHDVVGDTVNLAARLESVASVGEVVVGEGTYVRLPDGTVAEPLPALHVKGKHEPVKAYVLRSVPA